MKLGKVEESFKIFVDNSNNIIEFFKDSYDDGEKKDTNTIIKRNKLLISLIPINNIINKFNDVNLIEYYMNLSLIFEKLNFNLISLKFQIESMKIFNQFKQGLININSIETNEIDKIEINQQINCFKLSIKVENFELSYNTILNININNNNKSNELIQFNCIKIFINKLFEKNLIKDLIINYKFKNLIDKIDLILIEIIRKEEKLNFINSLKFYKILYSWRFKNGLIKESCEILYEFNLKLIKSQEENSNNKKLIKLTNNNNIGGSIIDDEVSGLKDKQLILVENYLIIINLLSTIKDEEDRYLIINNKIINNEGGEEGGGEEEEVGDSIIWINKIKEEYQSVLNDMRIILELNN
ncbi:unnamed protein product [[Candida] boidinii]|uniref:Unnamed protein product n=1 Tax=Candida boidinii TaxID=5477 RepID=A0ACB5TIB1_CANBO|nr:unnamed protein product [[Candida] boidinii]